jgi:hypothetical protein
MEPSSDATQQIGKMLEKEGQPKVVHRVREYRLLQAHSEAHLEELTQFLEKQGWKALGARRVMLASGDGKPVEYPWTQAMVVYDMSEKLR